jgi:hypothetical protein
MLETRYSGEYREKMRLFFGKMEKMSLAWWCCWYISITSRHCNRHLFIPFLNNFSYSSTIKDNGYSHVLLVSRLMDFPPSSQTLSSHLRATRSLNRIEISKVSDVNIGLLLVWKKRLSPWLKSQYRIFFHIYFSAKLPTTDSRGCLIRKRVVQWSRFATALRRCRNESKHDGHSNSIQSLAFYSEETDK